MMKSKCRGSPVLSGSSNTAISTGKPTNAFCRSRFVASDGLFGTRHSPCPNTICRRSPPISTRRATSGPTTLRCSGPSLSWTSMALEVDFTLRTACLRGMPRLGGIVTRLSSPTFPAHRDVEDLLAERGLTVSYETIRQWCQTFLQTVVIPPEGSAASFAA